MASVVIPSMFLIFNLGGAGRHQQSPEEARPSESQDATETTDSTTETNTDVEERHRHRTRCDNPGITSVCALRTSI